MNKLLSGPDDFSSSTWWSKFYASGEKLDWYGRIQEYMPLINNLAKPDAKLLQIGCGNALSEVVLYDFGYHSIHSIDIDKKLIEGRVKDTGTVMRPGLTYACVDASKLPEKDDTYDFIFDKGTLDALLPPNADDKKVEAATSMISEALRVLKPNGKYIIISLGQNHVLDVVNSYFQKRNDLFLYYYFVEVADGHNYIPAVVIQFQKLKKPMPESLKVIKLVLNYDKFITTNVTPSELVDILDEQRKFTYFTNQCRRPLDHIARISIVDQKTSKPRWSFVVRDRNSKPVRWIFLIFGAGHGYDLSDDDIVVKITDQCDFDRIVLSEQFEGMDYSQIHEELQSFSFRFHPYTADTEATVAYYFNSEDKPLPEVTVDSGEAPSVGNWTVNNIDHHGKATVRRLIFNDYPDIIQTDVLVTPQDEKDTVCKNVNVEKLFGLYQRMMVSVMEFRSGGLVESLKKPYNFAVLGVGGGTLVSFLHAVYKESKVTAVEIIPELYDVARKWFGYPADDERLTSISGDALEWVKDEKSGTYDFIFVDVSGSKDGIVTCPTVEFIDPAFVPLYKKRLNKHGIVVVNVVSRDLKFINEVLNGFRDNFKYISVGIPGDPSNEILIASDTPFKECKNYSVVHRKFLPIELDDVYEMAGLFKADVGKKGGDVDNDFLPAHLLAESGGKKNAEAGGKKNGNKKQKSNKKKPH